MKFIFLLIIFVTLFTSTSASAGKTGNELLAECTADENLLEGQIQFFECVAYINGVLDMREFFALRELRRNITDKGLNKEGMEETLICWPENASKDQAIDIIVALLRANPTDRHLPAHIFVIGALVRAWPCDLGD